MQADKTAPQTIDDYIAGFPPHVQEILQKIRTTVHEAAPDAQEAIKYLMPTFTQNGNLLSFGACKTHIGLYSAPEGNAKFRKELSAYKAAKSSVRFPLDQPIPYELIAQLVKFRVKEF